MKRTFEMELAGRTVKVETGNLAGQANGACMISCNDSYVLVVATMSEKPKEGIDFFPLSVDYEAKMYSVGKIPGGFTKREAKPPEHAILTSRLIDRPLRPLFDKGFRNEVQIIATVMSVDPDVEPEILAMIGSSVALSISNIPFAGPTGAVCVGMIDGECIINPNAEQKEKSVLDLTVAGTKDAVMMVEAGAKGITEAQMLDAILTAHEEIKKIVAFIETIVAEVGVEKATPAIQKPDAELEKAIRDEFFEDIKASLEPFDRYERKEKQDACNEKIISALEEKFPETIGDAGDVIYNITKEIVREKILDGVRPDGRTTEQIRPIWSEVGVLPRTHGTGIFTRGETQVLSITTLGTIGDVQKLDGITADVKKRYIHHYNFPGYSTGEPKPNRGPGRREIGHGALAERALLPVIPEEAEFPYTIRVVSEVLSSNGSTSQASICGSTLSLMDAGVPIKAPVAGVAMGLIKEKDGDRVSVLTDIQGLEDFLGDMDFKVAGTRDGITAIQMDIKIKGINKPVLERALEQARVGRLFILDKMLETIAEPRENLSKYAPKIISFKIDPDKIREVIGPGGKMINSIIDETGVKIDIDDDGTVYIATTDQEAMDKARGMIEAIVKEVEVGEVYLGTVVKIMAFGAFVELLPGKDGLCHISKLANHRVEKVEDEVKLGDKILVKVIKIDNNNRIDLSRKELIEQEKEMLKDLNNQ
ncbi:MAG: polyribonucleotide nucleotidyltransferase [Clostridia bacterium]|nr:polyribonucleotide nucleotidyltransferase [Clostridia bacterium]